MKIPPGLPPLPYVPRDATFEQRKQIYKQYMADIRGEDGCYPEKKNRSVVRKIKSLFRCRA